MRVRNLLWAAIIAFDLLVALPASAKGERELEKEIGDQAWRYLVARKFSDIDQLAATFRASKARTPSGQWKLALFYDEINSRFQVNSFASTPPEARASMLEKQWNFFEGELAAWKAQVPDSPTATIVLANLLVKKAHAARGGELAWGVEKDQWKGFKEALAKARMILEQDTAAKQDPGWFAVMLKVTALQADDAGFGRTLQELGKQAPDYHWAWFVATGYLQPKWGGSYEAIEALARFAEKSNAATSEGDSIYARIYWSLSGSTGRAEVFSDSKVSWPRMNEAFRAMSKRYPDSWNTNNHAVFACYAGDMKTLAPLLAQIEASEVEERAWESPTLFERCKARAQSASRSSQPKRSIEKPRSGA